MQVKSIAECSHWSILQYFLTFIKLPFVIQIFVLFISEWPLKTGFTVYTFMQVLSTFIKLPFVIKIFVLSISEWPLKTGFTVYTFMQV